MDIKAKIASGYRNRLILIAAGALLYSAWIVYDATVKYPRQLDIYTAYQETIKDNPDTWNEVWAQKAKLNGWDPQLTERSQGDINTQWYMFAITFPIGAFCLFSLILWSRRYIGADDSTLYATGGVAVPFDKITAINASRWEAKGIARVRYDLGAGQREVLIDDWKFEREPSDQIFQRLCEHVDPQQITGLSAPDADPSTDADNLAEPIDAEEATAASRG